MTTPSTGKSAISTGKEEGELTASDEEVQPLQTNTNAPLTKHVSVPSANRNIQRPQPGNVGSSNNPVDATSLTLSHHGGRKIEKKQATSIATIHGKNFPERGNNNLVISFSDDDSGSESDSKGRTQTLKIQPKATTSVNPSALLQTKLNVPRQFDNRVITKKASSASTFSHAATSKVANLSSAKEMKSNKFSYAIKSKVRKNTWRPEPVVGISNNKLQDLKQQIALRESELKIKAAQPKKDAINLKAGPTRRVSMVSGDVKQIESNEPAKKRLRVSEMDTSQPVADNIVPASAAAPMKEPDTRKSLLPGFDANASGKHLGSNSDDMDLPVISHCIVGGNTSSSALQDSVIKENHYNGVRCSQPDFPVHMTSRELETMRNVGRSVSTDPVLKIFNGSHQPYMNNSGLWNISGNTAARGHSQLDMLALTNLEQSLDRELEEAQERRRLCEVEERNALKVYRKAQRSLIEANARCAEIYSKRELCSSQFGSLLVRDTSLVWPSTHLEHRETGFHFSNNITENTGLETKPDTAQPTQLENNHQFINEYGRSHPLPYIHSGQNLGSEPCSDLDASTSDRLPCSDKQTASRLCSPLSDAHILLDDEQFPVDHESSQHNFGHQVKNLEKTQGNQNSLLLEASLRSALVDRLGIRGNSGGGTCFNAETAMDKIAENDVPSEQTPTDGGIPFSETHQQKDLTEPGATKLLESSSEPRVEQRTIQENQENFLNFESLDLESHRLSPEGNLLSSVAVPGPLFRSTITHLKATVSSFSSQRPDYTLQNKSYNLYTDERQSRSSTEIPVYERKFGFYTCDVKADPVWPLCMYELRGRCNNDECSLQHFKDFSADSVHQRIHDPPDARDESTSYQEKHNSAKRTQIVDVVLSPTYFVCLDTLRGDSCSFESLLARKHGQIWWKCFSLCLASSNSLYKNVPTKENEGRIEFLGNSGAHSSYFRSKNNPMNLLKQGSDASVQPLETALLIFCQEVNKSEGYIQALSLLSRGLESDPTSEILWTIYLLIYYAYERSDGKDMLSIAAKLTGGSYTLRLMYINSRGQLNDQLLAYDAALSALCNHASGSIDREHTSACILDLFLQMFNLLCISGNASEAIQRISRLQSPAAVSDDPHFSMMSDILTCLTFSDKCVFWVCCVYLVIYRKLPDSVVQRLEMEKELLEIEWPSITLVGDRKQMALSLFDRGVHSLGLSTTDALLENGLHERPAGLFALNHALFMIAVDELENCRDLLNSSVKLYPASLELKLLAARMQSNESKDIFSSGFEEILKREQKEASGTQCIWNQYAEYALQGGKYELARELMSRWYVSVWDMRSCKKKTIPDIEEEVDLTSMKSPLSDSNLASKQLNAMFGYLNLCLHSLLQNNRDEARSAIDQALKATTAPEHFLHCLREHATFQLIDEFQSTGEFPINEQLRLLNSYMDRASSFPVKEPLSWKFISNNGEKSRVKRLVSNLLAPLSPELAVVNVVLEAWHGPFLVPQKLSKQKELVDFVETILGLVPSNYPLALSVIKLVNKEQKHYLDSGSSGIDFWAGMNLVSTVSCAIPIPPEYIWVESGEILSKISGFKTKADSFLSKALSVYPCSVKLWRCYRNLCRSIEERRGVEIEEAAMKKGIRLD